jgi:hypothetical protein
LGEGELIFLTFALGFAGFFGTICYGLTILGRAISGRQRGRDVEALRAEVAQIRQELASTLLGQEDQIQRLGERVRSVEQALPPLRAGVAADEPTARLRSQGP